MTQGELALDLGISASRLAQAERGIGDLSNEALRRLAAHHPEVGEPLRHRRALALLSELGMDLSSLAGSASIVDMGLIREALADLHAIVGRAQSAGASLERVLDS